jgi:hypothetical protein
MAGIARIVVPGIPHHLTQLGNRRVRVFDSAAAHCGLRSDPLLAADFPPRGVVADWRAWLGTEEAAQIEFLRRQTRTGRPCGSHAFLAGLEHILKRALGP